MEESGKLLVYGTRADAELVVQTLYGVLPKYGKAYINNSTFYEKAYEVVYEFSGSTIGRVKTKLKICSACNKLRKIPRINNIKQL